MLDSTASRYAAVGIGLSVAGAALAVTRVRAAPSYYATDVYRLTARSHRRFAALSGVCGAGFALGLRWPALVTPLLTVYTLLLVLYLSSFARGYSGEDE